MDFLKNVNFIGFVSMAIRSAVFALYRAPSSCPRRFLKKKIEMLEPRFTTQIVAFESRDRNMADGINSGKNETDLKNLRRKDLKMTPYQLKDRLTELIKTERQTTNEILKLLNLALKTKAYLLLGYPSLFEWLVKGFGYSNAAAFRRIEAAKLLNTVPEVAKKLEAGTVNLSTLSKTQSIIKAQERASNQRLSATELAQVVEKIENKSTSETEQVLTGLFPEAAKSITQERRTVISGEVTRLAVNLDTKTFEDLNRAREVLSHHCATDAQVIAYALRFLLQKKDPLQKASPKNNKDWNQNQNNKTDPMQSTNNHFRSGSDLATQARMVATAQTKPSNDTSVDFRCGSLRPNPGQPRSISALRPRVIQAGGGRCSYRDPVTGKICGSRHLIQVDHKQPRALGGSNHPSNLRLLCRAHNLLMAERLLGREKMRKFSKETWRG